MAEPPGARRGRPAGWRFIDLAELGRNSTRSYAAALLRIVLYPLAFTVLIALAGAAVVPDSWAAANAVVLQFGPIVVAGMAVVRSVVRIHGRPWLSLVAAGLRIDWRRLAIGMGVQFAILAGQLALVHALTGWPWRFSLLAALPVFALAILLIPLQAASEEVLFRGYLTQALGRIVRSRILIAAVVGLIFGLLHLGVHGPLTVFYFFVFSLIFSLVSLRDEGLELVIGGHMATNLFGFGTANLTVLGPGIVGLDAGAMPFNWAAIAVLIVNGAIFYGITRLLVRVFCKPRSPV